MMTVYKHTSPSGRSYIGITKFTIEERFSNHIKSAKNKCDTSFQKAIIKYGSENFKSEILEVCENLEKANKLEKYYIKLFDTFQNGYNMTEGGYGRPVGWKHSEETKEKLRNKIVSEETRKKLSNSLSGLPTWNKGKTLTYEQKKNMRHDHTEETKLKLSQLKKGTTHTVETKEKISLSTKGINNPMFGKKHSEETREKIKMSLGKRVWVKHIELNVSSRIKEEELEKFISEGWIRGMLKINKNETCACLTELVSLTNNK